MHAIDRSGESHRMRKPICIRIHAGLAVVLAASIGSALLVTAPVFAQELPRLPEPKQMNGEFEPTHPEEIAARRAALGGELAANERAIASSRDGSTRAHLDELRETLLSIDALLRQQAELAKPIAEPGFARLVPPEVAQPPLFELDRLHEQQFEHEQQKKRLADALAASREALATAKEKLDKAERERRDAHQEFEATAPGSAKSNAARKLALRQLASRAAQERVHLRTLEVRVFQREHEVLGGPVSEIAERIDELRAALARGEGESDAGYAALSEREGEQRRLRGAIERELSTVELRLDAAQQRFSRQADPPAELLEEVEALTVKRDAIREEIALIDARLELYAAQRIAWRQWEALLRNQVSRGELESWKTPVMERVDALERAELQQRGRRAYLDRQLTALQTRLLSLPENTRVRDLLEEQRETLTRLLASDRSEAAELAHDRRFSERLLAELRTRTGELNPLEYALNGVQAMRDIWNYEFTSVDDAPITVESLVLALALAGLGFWISRRGSTLIGRTAMSRFKLDEGAAHALQSLAFYVLLASFTLLALRAVHFPLTAFTVLGGALAIGVGFGSQNVMNNFISGLIIMLERPIRARDVVEIDGNNGVIEKIGARSTQIRSTNGRHIIVPNSFFLENNVVNWTLSDDLIRTSVSVGVIYGSPTRLVEELIQRVIDDDGTVLAQPEPIILFEDFGDNSLNFAVHFWMRTRSPMEVRRAQSRVRFAIDDLFREHDLVIAFPQRDVHVDSVSPIEVRVLNGGESPAVRALSGQEILNG